MNEINPIMAIGKNEIQLCGGWCSWNECNEPKWICSRCGYVACDSCIEDYEDIIMFDEQYGWGIDVCRNCGLTEYHEFTEGLEQEFLDKTTL